MKKYIRGGSGKQSKSEEPDSRLSFRHHTKSEGPGASAHSGSPKTPLNRMTLGLLLIFSFRFFCALPPALSLNCTKRYTRKWTRDFDPWPRSADTHLTHRVRSAAPVL